jgi:signal transduction histidine kinase
MNNTTRKLRKFTAGIAATWLATAIILTLVALPLMILADHLASRFDLSARWFQLGALFFAIFFVIPIRDRMQDLVGRRMDRDRAAYREAVREISEALISMLSLDEITDRILEALIDTMGVDRAMVLLQNREGGALRPMASRGDWDMRALTSVVLPHHPIREHLWLRREGLARADFNDEPDLEDREACWEIFDTLDVTLLIPIVYGAGLVGVIAVGRKLSGGSLIGDDRDLLRTLANNASVAIENAKAFDEIASLNETLEARVEKRTAELRKTQAQLMQAEKMKSLGQLVAGVAHEINNPIGFVHANLQLLDEYIAKLLDGKPAGAEATRVRAAISSLLLRSREGTQRVTKIVQDLRAFSRMDEAELQDVDLHEEIDLTLALVEPRLKHKIAIERDYGDLPRVRCFAGQLNQVFMNLLMNACDAISRDGRINITTRATPEGVRISFKDNGSGIPDDIKTRIFDPFFTTKSVGLGTGLGLSLAHGIVERHQGRIEVRSRPGFGSTFIIDLPLDPTPDSGAAD